MEDNGQDDKPKCGNCENFGRDECPRKLQGVKPDDEKCYKHGYKS